MGKYDRSLSVISSHMAFRSSGSDRAPSPHLPPPVSSAVRRDLFGGFASMLLLVPTEAGIGKAGELDRELLACCAEAEASERVATVTMDVVETMDADDPDMTSAVLAAHPVFQDHKAVARHEGCPAVLRQGGMLPSISVSPVTCSSVLTAFDPAAMLKDSGPSSTSRAMVARRAFMNR